MREPSIASSLAAAVAQLGPSRGAMGPAPPQFSDDEYSDSALLTVIWHKLSGNDPDAGYNVAELLPNDVSVATPVCASSTDLRQELASVFVNYAASTAGDAEADSMMSLPNFRCCMRDAGVLPAFDFQLDGRRSDSSPSALTQKNPGYDDASAALDIIYAGCVRGQAARAGILSDIGESKGLSFEIFLWALSRVALLVCPAGLKSVLVAGHQEGVQLALFHFMCVMEGARRVGDVGKGEDLLTSGAVEAFREGAAPLERLFLAFAEGTGHPTPHSDGASMPLHPNLYHFAEEFGLCPGLVSRHKLLQVFFVTNPSRTALLFPGFVEVIGRLALIIYGDKSRKGEFPTPGRQVEAMIRMLRSVPAYTSLCADQRRRGLRTIASEKLWDCDATGAGSRHLVSRMSDANRQTGSPHAQERAAEAEDDGLALLSGTGAAGEANRPIGEAVKAVITDVGAVMARRTPRALAACRQSVAAKPTGVGEGTHDGALHQFLASSMIHRTPLAPAPAAVSPATARPFSPRNSPRNAHISPLRYTPGVSSLSQSMRIDLGSIDGREGAVVGGVVGGPRNSGSSSRVTTGRLHAAAAAAGAAAVGGLSVGTAPPPLPPSPIKQRQAHRAQAAVQESLESAATDESAETEQPALPDPHPPAHARLTVHGTRSTRALRSASLKRMRVAELSGLGGVINASEEAGLLHLAGKPAFSHGFVRANSASATGSASASYSSSVGLKSQSFGQGAGLGQSFTSSVSGVTGLSSAESARSVVQAVSRGIPTPFPLPGMASLAASRALAHAGLAKMSAEVDDAVQIAREEASAQYCATAQRSAAGGVRTARSMPPALPNLGRYHVVDPGILEELCAEFAHTLPALHPIFLFYCRAGGDAGNTGVMSYRNFLSLLRDMDVIDERVDVPAVQFQLHVLAGRQGREGMESRGGQGGLSPTAFLEAILRMSELVRHAQATPAVAGEPALSPRSRPPSPHKKSVFSDGQRQGARGEEEATHSADLDRAKAVAFDFISRRLTPLLSMALEEDASAAALDTSALRDSHGPFLQRLFGQYAVQMPSFMNASGSYEGGYLPSFAIQRSGWLRLCRDLEIFPSLTSIVGAEASFFASARKSGSDAAEPGLSGEAGLSASRMGGPTMSASRAGPTTRGRRLQAVSLAIPEASAAPARQGQVQAHRSSSSAWLPYDAFIECLARTALLAFSRPYLGAVYPSPADKAIGLLGWIQASRKLRLDVAWGCEGQEGGRSQVKAARKAGLLGSRKPVGRDTGNGVRGGSFMGYSSLAPMTGEEILAQLDSAGLEEGAGAMPLPPWTTVGFTSTATDAAVAVTSMVDSRTLARATSSRGAGARLDPVQAVVQAVLGPASKGKDNGSRASADALGLVADAVHAAASRFGVDPDTARRLTGAVRTAAVDAVLVQGSELGLTADDLSPSPSSPSDYPKPYASRRLHRDLAVRHMADTEAEARARAREVVDEEEASPVLVEKAQEEEEQAMPLQTAASLPAMPPSALFHRGETAFYSRQVAARGAAATRIVQTHLRPFDGPVQQAYLVQAQVARLALQSRRRSTDVVLQGHGHRDLQDQESSAATGEDPLVGKDEDGEGVEEPLAALAALLEASCAAPPPSAAGLTVSELSPRARVAMSYQPRYREEEGASYAHGAAPLSVPLRQEVVREFWATLRSDSMTQGGAGSSTEFRVQRAGTGTVLHHIDLQHQTSTDAELDIPAAADPKRAPQPRLWRPLSSVGTPSNRGHIGAVPPQCPPAPTATAGRVVKALGPSAREEGGRTGRGARSVGRTRPIRGLVAPYPSPFTSSLGNVESGQVEAGAGGHQHEEQDVQKEGQGQEARALLSSLLSSSLAWQTATSSTPVHSPATAAPGTSPPHDAAVPLRYTSPTRIAGGGGLSFAQSFAAAMAGSPPPSAGSAAGAGVDRSVLAGQASSLLSSTGLGMVSATATQARLDRVIDKLTASPGSTKSAGQRGSGLGAEVAGGRLPRALPRGSSTTRGSTPQTTPSAEQAMRFRKAAEDEPEDESAAYEIE